MDSLVKSLSTKPKVEVVLRNTSLTYVNKTVRFILSRLGLGFISCIPL